MALSESAESALDSYQRGILNQSHDISCFDSDGEGSVSGADIWTLHGPPLRAVRDE